MSEILPGEIKSSEPNVLSVEQLNLSVKQILEGQIGQVWVRGEISNFKAHTSGHYYFSLKDSKSQVSAVMFRGNNSRLKFKLHDGLEVLARGRISVYEPRGNYQIVCDTMEPIGAGALQKAFEQLKTKLKAEGLFESARKRVIPPYPRHIAIVTSPTGAAVRDILNILGRRARGIRVTVVPTVVQGEGAALHIAAAFSKAIALAEVDAVIIGRGGGSMEDLWAFNDENLVRLMAGSPIPVISAVGHEVDFTISDFVADLRAPTPSAAAELVAKNSADLVQRIESMERMLMLSLQKSLRSWKEKAYGLSKRLVDPQRRLQDLNLRNDDLFTRLDLARARMFSDHRHHLKLLRQQMGNPQDLITDRRKELDYLNLRSKQNVKNYLERRHSQLGRMMSVLDSLSPLKVVDRGYSIVTHESKVVKSADQLKKGDTIDIRLALGSLTAQVERIIAPAKEN